MRRTISVLSNKFQCIFRFANSVVSMHRFASGLPRYPCHSRLIQNIWMPKWMPHFRRANLPWKPAPERTIKPTFALPPIFLILLHRLNSPCNLYDHQNFNTQILKIFKLNIFMIENSPGNLKRYAASRSHHRFRIFLTIFFRTTTTEQLRRWLMMLFGATCSHCPVLLRSSNGNLHGKPTIFSLHGTPNRRLLDTAKSNIDLKMLRRLLIHPPKQRAFQPKRDRLR